MEITSPEEVYSVKCSSCKAGLEVRAQDLRRTTLKKSGKINKIFPKKINFIRCKNCGCILIIAKSL